MPRDKFDFERVQIISKMKREEVVPLLPGLLEWMQDRNWPIAVEVIDILLSYPKEVVPHLKNIFNTDDYTWKYWCLECLVKEFPLEGKLLLKDELIRLADSPTKGEKLEETDILAMEILQSID